MLLGRKYTECSFLIAIDWLTDWLIDWMMDCFISLFVCSLWFYLFIYISIMHAVKFFRDGSTEVLALAIWFGAIHIHLQILAQRSNTIYRDQMLISSNYITRASIDLSQRRWFLKTPNNKGHFKKQGVENFNKESTNCKVAFSLMCFH